MSWLGERVNLSKEVEAHMDANRRAWKRCTGRCGRKLLALVTDQEPLCMACDPTMEQIQPGVFRTKI
jgi:hypothetical protein